MADTLFPMVFLSIAALSLFGFLTVAAWTDARRKEREAYYKAETTRRLAEMQGPSAANIIEILREEDRLAVRRRRESTRLGGLVTAAVGLGLGIFLRGIEREDPVYLVALIPLLVGVALLIYSWLAPREATV